MTLLLLFYIIILIFCRSEGVFYDVTQWLCLLLTMNYNGFHDFNEGMKMELPLGSSLVFIWAVIPNFLCPATIIWGCVSRPEAQWTHCDFDLTMKAPKRADDWVDGQVVQKLYTFPSFLRIKSWDYTGSKRELFNTLKGRDPESFRMELLDWLWELRV